MSLDFARAYARRMTGCRNPQLTLTTLTGHPDFPEAAAEARWPSVSFAATKLPLVNPRLRPEAARDRIARQLPYNAIVTIQLLQGLAGYFVFTQDNETRRFFIRTSGYEIKNRYVICHQYGKLDYISIYFALDIGCTDDDDASP